MKEKPSTSYYADPAQYMENSTVAAPAPVVATTSGPSYSPPNSKTGYKAGKH